MIEVSTAERYCTKCGKMKLSSEFHKDKHAKDGLCSWCRDCKNEATRARKSLKSQEKPHFFAPDEARICLNCTLPDCAIEEPLECPWRRDER